MADMCAKDWFISGWFYALDLLREDPDISRLPQINQLRRDKAYRLGFRKGVEAYETLVESFMCPKGE